MIFKHSLLVFSGIILIGLIHGHGNHEDGPHKPKGLGQRRPVYLGPRRPGHQGQRRPGHQGQRGPTHHGRRRPLHRAPKKILKQEPIRIKCKKWGMPGQQGKVGQQGNMGLHGIMGQAGLIGQMGDRGHYGPHGPKGPKGPPALIRKLKHAAFFAQISPDKKHTSIGPVKKEQTVIFKKVVTNIGGMYDPDTGYFTAPCDGVYKFTLNILGGKHQGAEVSIRIGAVTLVKAFGPKDHATATTSVIILMKGGARVHVVLAKGKSVDTIGIYSSFTGALIYDLSTPEYVEPPTKEAQDLLGFSELDPRMDIFRRLGFMPYTLSAMIH